MNGVTCYAIWEMYTLSNQLQLQKKLDYLSLKFNKQESTSSEFILTSTSPSRKTSLSSLSVPEKGSDIPTGFNGTVSVCLGSCFSRTGGNDRIFTN